MYKNSNKHLIIYTTILTIILILFGISISSSKYNRMKLLSDLNKAINSSSIISKTIHSLQKERGLSVGVFLDDGENFTKDLKIQRDITDSLLKKLQNYKNSQFLNNFFKASKMIISIREKIDKKKFSLKEILNYYSNLNQELLHAITHSTKKYNIGEIGNSIEAYRHFLYVKEYTGIERALGVIIFSTKKIDFDLIKEFSYVIELQKFNMSMFKILVDKKILKECNNGSKFSKIVLVENKISNRKLEIIEPKKWFNLITQKIDHLDKMSQKIENRIINRIENEFQKSYYAYMVALGLIVLGIILFVILMKNILNIIEKEKNLRTILDQHIMNAQIDRDGKILDISDAYCSVLGYKKEELLQKNIKTILDDSEIKKIDIIRKEIEKARRWGGKLKKRKYNGSVFYTYTNIEPIITNSETDTFLSINIDITENEKLLDKLKDEEKKRLAQQEILQHQYRLAKMGEMLSMIAHQWRQPLNAITATCGVIKMKASLDKLTKEDAIMFSDKIKNLSIDLSQIIDDFKNFYKKNKSKNLTSFESIVKKVLFILGSSLEEKAIKVNLKTISCEEIYTFENELKQAVLNIVKNAEDALVLREIKTPEINITIEKKTLTIEDNAGGISKEIEDKIFDPYFSTKGKKEGTGLGLYMSKIIIEEHCGGKLSFISKNGKTTFKIEL